MIVYDRIRSLSGQICPIVYDRFTFKYAQIRSYTLNHLSMGRIEDGRRTKPKTPREQRTCFQCPTQVEDEKHFLVDCKLYGSRPQLYNIIEGICPEFTRLDNQNKFIYLMTQESQAITTSLVSELEDWLNLRELLCTYFFQP